MMSIVLKTLLFISAFFVFGLAISFFGLKFPSSFQSNSVFTWIIIVICLTMLGVIFELFFGRLKQKYVNRFWEMFSETEIKNINKIIMLLLFLAIVTSIVFGMLN